MLNKLKEICSNLSGWMVKENHERSCSLLHVSGAEIHIYEDWKGKVEARGQFPRDEKDEYMDASRWGLVEYGKSNPTIGFNINKDAAKIAKDLESRLMPVYMPMYAKAVEKLNKRLVEKENKENKIAELAKIIGSKHRGNIFSEYMDDYSITCEISYDNNVRLDLSVDFETAKKILKLLKK